MWKDFSPYAESRGVRGGFEAASLRGHGSDAGEYRPRMGEPVGEEGHIKEGCGNSKATAACEGRVQEGDRGGKE